MLLGDGEIANDIEKVARENPQFGYSIVGRITENSATNEPQRLRAAVTELSANIVVVPRHLKRESKLLSALYAFSGANRRHRSCGFL